MALQDILDRLGSDPLIRYWGPYNSYDPAEGHKNVLFLATDQYKIYFNGVEYGSLDANNQGFVENSHDDNPETFNLGDWVTIAELNSSGATGIVTVSSSWGGGVPKGLILAVSSIQSLSVNEPTKQLFNVKVLNPLNPVYDWEDPTYGGSQGYAFDRARVLRTTQSPYKAVLQVRVAVNSTNSIRVTRLGKVIKCVISKQNDPLSNQLVVGECNLVPPTVELNNFDFLSSISAGSREITSEQFRTFINSIYPGTPHVILRTTWAYKRNDKIAASEFPNHDNYVSLAGSVIEIHRYKPGMANDPSKDVSVHNWLKVIIHTHNTGENATSSLTRVNGIYEYDYYNTDQTITEKWNYFKPTNDLLKEVTQAQYDALTYKEPNTLYLIPES